MTDPFDQALEDIFETLGQDAVFTPSSGDPVDCKVNLEQDTGLKPSGFDATTWVQGTVIEARLAEIGKEPDRGETFTVAGTVYTVKSIDENDGHTVKAVVK